MKMFKKDQEKQVKDEKEKDFDPRRHRLKLGIRHWKKNDESFVNPGIRIKDA